eukprot:scaffold56508_cov66-Cyclotella_meneghiniana.AAC.1
MHWFSRARARMLCTLGRPMMGEMVPKWLATSEYINCWTAAWMGGAGWAAIFRWWSLQYGGNDWVYCTQWVAML